MKKLFLILAIALVSCSSPEETKNECDCKAVVFVNGIANGQTWNYSKDCKDEGFVIETYEETGYFAQTIVKCK